MMSSFGVHFITLMVWFANVIESNVDFCCTMGWKPELGWCYVHRLRNKYEQNLDVVSYALLVSFFVSIERQNWEKENYLCKEYIVALYIEQCIKWWDLL